MHAYEFFSAQSGPHHDLLPLVHRYKNSDFRRPIPSVQQIAFDRIVAFHAERQRPLIIDSGCGTAMSTIKLAEIFPDHDVIGIDKSAHRLMRADTANARDNFLLVRGDLIDQWRLLAAARMPITHHFILYPNPWPKISQVKRRFYAHPVFATMLRLAPYLEVRTNWRVYAEELMIALDACDQKPELSMKTDNDFMTRFEKKYQEAGSELFVVTNRLA